MMRFYVDRELVLSNKAYRPIAVMYGGDRCGRKPISESVGLDPIHQTFLSNSDTGSYYISLVFQPLPTTLRIQSRFNDINYLDDCQTCLYRKGFKCDGMVREQPANPTYRCFIDPEAGEKQIRHVKVTLPSFMYQFRYLYNELSDHKLYVPGPASASKDSLIVAPLFTGNTHYDGSVCTGSVSARTRTIGNKRYPLNIMEKIFAGLHNNDLSIPHKGTLSSWFANFEQNASYTGILTKALEARWSRFLRQMPLGPDYMFIPNGTEQIESVYLLKNSHSPDLYKSNVLIKTTERYFYALNQTTYPLDGAEVN